jgi:ABC-type dipeptide/oligopeptide/nickel transport system permease component
VAKYFVVSSVAVLAINTIEYILNEKKIKKISMFCHAFGSVTGFLVGLVSFNDRSSWNKKIVEVVSLVIYLTISTLLAIIYLLQIRIKYMDLGEHLAHLNQTNGSVEISHYNNY